MNILKDIEDNLKSSYSLINERGILGGIYFGIIAFCLFCSKFLIVVCIISYQLIFIISILIGIIISNISFEALIPVYNLTRHIVLKKANSIIDHKQFNNYNELRLYREEYLSNGSNIQIKERIRGHEKYRTTLTYINSTSVASFLFVLYFNWKISIVDVHLSSLLQTIITFVFIVTLIGIFRRANSLGLYIGLAYKNDNPTNSN